MVIKGMLNSLFSYSQGGLKDNGIWSRVNKVEKICGLKLAEGAEMSC